MLIKGSNLTPDQKREVLNSFPYRWTHENPNREYFWENMDKPTMPLETDEQWLKSRAFYFTKEGVLSKVRRYAEPAYLAD